MILVTGASGQVGKHLLQALSAKGMSTRAWIHSERNKEAVLAAGATEVYVGDLTSSEDADAAMKGIDTVYYICNTANPQEDVRKVRKELKNGIYNFRKYGYSDIQDMCRLHELWQGRNDARLDIG